MYWKILDTGLIKFSILAVILIWTLISMQLALMQNPPDPWIGWRVLLGAMT